MPLDDDEMDEELDASGKITNGFIVREIVMGQIIFQELENDEVWFVLTDANQPQLRSQAYWILGKELRSTSILTAWVAKSPSTDVDKLIQDMTTDQESTTAFIIRLERLVNTEHLFTVTTDISA
jgi:hypothetical protein